MATISFLYKLWPALQKNSPSKLHFLSPKNSKSYQALCKPPSSLLFLGQHHLVEDSGYPKPVFWPDPVSHLSQSRMQYITMICSPAHMYVVAASLELGHTIIPCLMTSQILVSPKSVPVFLRAHPIGIWSFIEHSGCLPHETSLLNKSSRETAKGSQQLQCIIFVIFFLHSKNVQEFLWCFEIIHVHQILKVCGFHQVGIPSIRDVSGVIKLPKFILTSLKYSEVLHAFIYLGHRAINLSSSNKI